MSPTESADLTDEPSPSETPEPSKGARTAPNGSGSPLGDIPVESTGNPDVDVAMQRLRDIPGDDPEKAVGILGDVLARLEQILKQPSGSAQPSGPAQ